MIKNITSTGKYMNVVGGPASNYVNNYSGAQGIGNMRFNTSNQNIEVYDGNNWVTLNMGHASVGLNHRAEELLDWAERKRNEERELESLAETNPTIKDLMDQIKQKQEQIKVVQTLIKQDVKI
jgi:hypothetical protein